MQDSSQTDRLPEPDLAWLRRLAAALVREPNAAEDLVQDTLLAASRSGGTFDSERAWLSTVARRLASRGRRREAARLRREAAAAQDEQLPDSTELVERAEVAEAVVRAARELDEPFRTTLLAHFLDGRSVAEIARADGRPEDTVRWRIRKGLDRLRAHLSRDGRDWSQWSVLLIPLARAPHGTTGLAAAGTASGAAGVLAASWISMKTLTVSSVAVIALSAFTAWFYWTETPPEPASDSNDVPRVAASSSTIPEPGSAPARTTQTASLATRREPTASRSPSRTTRDENRFAPSIFVCRVSDRRGRAIPAARIELVAADDPLNVLTAGSADDDGVIRIDRSRVTGRAELGVIATADGWLRSIVEPSELERAMSEVQVAPYPIVLQAGVRLEGRVVDRSGRPVQDLNLRIHPRNAAVSHVSLSSVALRVERRQRDVRDAEFQTTTGRTEADGSIVFDAVPPEMDLVARSLDPDWQIVGPGAFPGRTGFVEWVAEPTFGVIVRAIDARTGEPVKASATFNVEVERTDGTVEKTGQWVGKGRSGVSFAIDYDLWPDLESMDLSRVTFFGTLTTMTGSNEWRSNPIFVSGTERRAEVDVLVTASTEDGEIPSSMPNMTVVLDVLDANGQPFLGGLNLAWSSETSRGNPQDDTRPTRTSPGFFRAEIPVPSDIDTLDLSIARENASGSLPAFRTRIPATFDQVQQISLQLPPAATITVLRPAGWDGGWTVDAAYRENADEDWFGAWTYGTDKDRLILNGVRPAEWRLLLRREGSSEPREVLVNVRSGDSPLVGG
ncbi:MAG: RNA polymerase sigma factor [Planctomycetota bacterium]